MLAYLPNGAAHDLWEAIGPFVRETVINGGCTSQSGVYVALKAVSSFAAWAFRQGMPLERERVFDEATVERFVATELSALSASSRATYASTLRRIGRLWTRRAYWSPKPEEISRKVLAPPYTSDEVSWLWQIADSQKTEVGKRRATALLALALGAGLKAHEVVATHSTDVEFRDDAVLVHVVGARARRVPVLPPAHAALRWLCAEYDGSLLHADPDVRRTTPSFLSRDLELPYRAPSFDAPRLRTTWLVDMLTTGLTLSEVYRYAGTESTQALRDLLPYVPERDEAAVFADIARWTR